MAISFVGSVTGTTSATLPTHQAGDLIVAFAYRDGSTVQPALPSGWTDIRISDTINNSSRLAYRRASAAGTVTGTWSNATSTIFLIYRGVDAIGASAFAGGTTASLTYPALTLQRDTGGSVVLGFAGHRSVNTTLETPPTGMTLRATTLDTTDEAAAHTTAIGVTAWAGGTVAVGGTASNWNVYTLELMAPVIPVGSTVTIALTAGKTSWTVPAGCLRLSEIHCIANAGNGIAVSAGVGYKSGGGGAYAGILNMDVTPGAVINCQVGASGSNNDTWFGSTATVLAKPGSSATSTTIGTGGLASGSVGTLKYSGGDGTQGSNSQGLHVGGGGAAGPHGNGGNGGVANGSNGNLGGGGGCDGGTSGGAGTPGLGPTGTSLGGGGAGGVVGSQYPIWTDSYSGLVVGPAGGGGGNAAGGTFGGGAGSGASTPGGAGVIVLVYTMQASSTPTILIGSTPVTAIYLGTTPISKVYLGSVKIWRSARRRAAVTGRRRHLMPDRRLSPPVRRAA